MCPMSPQDFEQVIKFSFDQPNEALKVSVVGGEIQISHLDDSIKIGDGTNLVEVTNANQLRVDGSGVIQPVSATELPLPNGAATETTLSSIHSKIQQNTLSILNSSNTPLLAGETFTGAWENLLDYASVILSLTSDIVSDIDGVKVQFSTNGIDVNFEEVFTYNPGYLSRAWFRAAQYFRIIYVNDLGLNQTFFRLQVIFNNEPIASSMDSLINAIPANTTGLITKSAIFTQSVSGAGFNQVIGPGDGSLFASLTDGFGAQITATAVGPKLGEDVNVIGGHLSISDPNTNLETNVVTLTDQTLNLDNTNAQVTAAVTHGRVDDNIIKGMRLDSITEASLVIDYPHHKIHEGTNWIIKNWVDLTGLASTYDIGITVPDSSTLSHIVMQFKTETGFTIDLYEDSTYSAGTPITPYNSNRNSSNIASLAFDAAPTVTVLGTKIKAWRTSSGVNSVGDGRTRTELLLKINTQYVVRFTKMATGIDFVDYLFDWYEHINLN